MRRLLRSISEENLYYLTLQLIYLIVFWFLSSTDIPKFICMKIFLYILNQNSCLRDALMSCEYIEKKVKLCFQIILHRFLVFTMKRPYCKPKKVPQNIFQQGYFAAYASRVNCEMLWYPSRVGEPKYCSGVSQIVHLPQNLLQKFKKTVMVIFPCQGVMSYVTQPRLLGNETEKQ